MSKKRSIPPIPTGIEPSMEKVLSPMKENLEIIMGHRSAKLDLLTSGASTAEIIAKLNALLGRLQ